VTKTPVLPVLLLTCFAAFSQQSESYKLSEHTLNGGGHPADGTVLASTSYRIKLDALGDALVGPGLASASFRMDPGFVAPYPPPGEVTGLRFADPTTLAWDAERSIGDYNLYRDLLSNLSGLGYGTCLRQRIPDEATTDNDAVPLGDGFFYLVTAENRLDEEGTKGADSTGLTRTGTACP
jgi:hypothetical protein